MAESRIVIDTNVSVLLLRTFVHMYTYVKLIFAFPFLCLTLVEIIPVVKL